MRLDLGSNLGRLTALQRAMGIDSTVVELPPAEMAALRNTGVEVSPDQVQSDAESVLRYKGEVVVLYIKNQGAAGGSDVSQFKFHVADCRTLHRMRAAGRGERYVVSNRDDGLFPVSGSAGPHVAARLLKMTVCRDCLSSLDWDGYRTSADAYRSGPASFDIRAFFATYRNVRAWPPEIRRRPRPPTPLQSGAAPIYTGPRGWAPAVAPAGTTPVPAASQAPVATPDSATDAPPEPPVVVWPEWSMAVLDLQMRGALLHIDRHGVLSEADLLHMVGDARRVRRFSMACNDWTQQAPFRIQVTVHHGVRTFRRNPPRRGP